MNKIIVLENETAKRIAAGEVIEKPASVLRELLDNAIDSGAKNITVTLESGGIALLRVSDDGSGMAKNDLALCVLPHATSKISVLSDLDKLSTLGFRGEALSSISAVADLQIISSEDDINAWQMESFPLHEIKIKPVSAAKGTSVTVKNLFENFPARKKFLKKATAESLVCKNVFVEKAMAFPNIAFKLISDSKLVYVLQSSSLLERVSYLSKEAQGFFRELYAQGNGFSAKIIAALPEIYKGDRKNIAIFINQRRIYDFAISQAVEYAYRASLPGGQFPVCYVFINVDPSLADFNIHPAKKEVRLKNIEDIRHGLIKAISDYLSAHNRVLYSAPNFSNNVAEQSEIGIKKQNTLEFADSNYFPKQTKNSSEYDSWNKIAELVHKKSLENDKIEKNLSKENLAIDNCSFKYLGRAFDLFIMFEINDELYFMDQHAAHERILYEEIMAKKVVTEELLVPLVYEAKDSEEDLYIEKHLDTFFASGYRIKKECSSWVLESAPVMLKESMTGQIFDLLKTKPDPKMLLHEIAATTACRAAIKDGDFVDDKTAISLIKVAIALPEHRCPHGRPIWFIVSKTDLFKAVRRITS